jgi:hypothetical protein
MSLVSPSGPRISVIVPAYGVAHLLGEALASLQARSLALPVMRLFPALAPPLLRLRLRLPEPSRR